MKFGESSGASGGPGKKSRRLDNEQIRKDKKAVTLNKPVERHIFPREQTLVVPPHPLIAALYPAPERIGSSQLHCGLVNSDWLVQLSQGVHLLGSRIGVVSSRHDQ